MSRDVYAYFHVRLSDHEYLARWRLGALHPEDLLLDGRWMEGLTICDIAGEIQSNTVFQTLSLADLVMYSAVNAPDLHQALLEANHSNAVSMIGRKSG